MSNRVKNAEAALDLLNKIEIGADYVFDAVDTYYGVVVEKIEVVREKVTDELAKAKAQEKSDEAREQKTQDTVEKVFGLLKDARIKSFYDSVVNPAKTPGDGPVAGGEPTRDEKIEYVRTYYKKHAGVDVWPNTNTLNDDAVDYVYNLIKK